MSEFKLHPTRRGFIQGSVATAGLGALTLSPFGPAFAA